PDLQRTLAAYRDEGVDVVAMEVSSHALSLHRVDALRVEVGVFTNLGIDHLDFHGTQESYFAAKAKLFEPGRCRVGIVNVDDVHGRLLVDAGGDELRPVSARDVTDVVTTRRGSAFTWRDRRVELPMPGDHNVMNALLAAESCHALGVPDDLVAAGLSALPPVPGRFETFGGDDDPAVIVDFAHTPEALEHALVTARTLLDPRGRLTVVFGCGGDRDRGKRPLMGEVACRLADVVVVTSDNPRSEDPSEIISQVVAGCVSEPTTELDRRSAIADAVRAASADDIVLVAGKGHEQGQVFADRVVPFDDRDVVRAALADRSGGGER
ncbi:MAG: UDP-N-acetylmuramoyl-L-alanyl-D-glutamate--2,6-diaminopimelate ligase, partial [Actinomycetota bacterium]|nr:UDP-N-acetylmuramoyl-L-alanyl-D-glutamate--2,6-diaminopimelate ligase [Actinomycetota bacterium]